MVWDGKFIRKYQVPSQMARGLELILSEYLVEEPAPKITEKKKPAAIRKTKSS
jgi:hypothetical protein